jgi:ribosomal protein L21E
MMKASVSARREAVMQKAGRRDVSRLTKKVITDKNGKMTTVYVDPTTGKGIPHHEKIYIEQFGSSAGKHADRVAAEKKYSETLARVREIENEDDTEVKGIIDDHDAGKIDKQEMEKRFEKIDEVARAEHQKNRDALIEKEKQHPTYSETKTRNEIFRMRNRGMDV